MLQTGTNMFSQCLRGYHALSLFCLGRYKSISWPAASAVNFCLGHPVCPPVLDSVCHNGVVLLCVYVTSTMQKTYTSHSARCARLARRFTDGKKVTRTCSKRIAEKRKRIQEIRKNMSKTKIFVKIERKGCERLT